MGKERIDIMAKFYIDEWGNIFKVSEVEGEYRVESNSGDIVLVKDLKETYLCEEIHNDKAELLMKKQYELQTKLDAILNELDTYKDLKLYGEDIEYVGE